MRSYWKRGLGLLLAAIMVAATGCNASKNPESTPDTMSDDIRPTVATPDFKPQTSDGSPVFSIDAQLQGRLPADAPTPPGDTYSEPKSEAAADTKVLISGVTRQADPGDSIVIQGEGFSGGNQKVLIHAGTTNGDQKLYEAKILYANDTTITAAIPTDAPYSAYTVYVKNDNGTSPHAHINTPDVWWISETNGMKGDKLSIYGVNLSTKNATETSHVYLHLGGEDPAKHSVKANVTYADPYKVTFEIPDGLQTGWQYEVWLHNGHGGEQGWAAAPQYLTVTSGKTLEWKGETVRVEGFTAEAIQAAVDAASDNDTILFSAGTYTITKPINVKNASIRFLGADREKTIIDTSGMKAISINVSVFPFQVENMSFRDVRQSEAFPAFMEMRGDNYDTGVPNVVVENNKFEVLNTGDKAVQPNSLLLYSLTSIYIRNNEFLNPSCMFGNNIKKLFFTDNHCVGNFITGPYDGSQQLHLRDGAMLDVSDNKMEGEDNITDPKGTLKEGDKCINRSVVLHGSFSGVYIAANDINRAGSPIDNSGEQIMFESPFTDYIGAAKTIGDIGLTFEDPNFEMPQKGAVVSIISGKGEGQSRHVVKGKDNTITLDSPWIVQPDTASQFSISRIFENVVVYANQVNGFKNFNEKSNAGSGIQLYGNLVNGFFTKNKFSNYMYGMQISPHYCGAAFGPSFNSNQILWLTVDGNNIYNVRRGIHIIMVYEGATKVDEGTTAKVHTVMNSVLRRNTIKDAVYSPHNVLKGIGGDAIAVGTNLRGYADWNESATWLGDWIKNTVIENNTIANTAGPAILLQKHQGDTILRGNTITNAAGGEVAVDKYAQESIRVD